MSAQLPRPSASPGAAPGRTVIRGKIAMATQRQRERAFLLANVDKSREPVIDKSRDMISRAAPATPSSVERANRQLHRSQMRQVNIPLQASTLSPILDLPESIAELPPTVVGLPPTDADPIDQDITLPPTVERISRDEQHEAGGGDGLGLGFAQDLAPSMLSTSPAASHHGQALDDNHDPFFRCAANRLCRSMGDQTSQFLNCINCNQLAHLFCAEYLIGQTPVDDETSYITVKDFSKEGKARWRKTLSNEKDNIAFCILCSAKIKAVKVSAEAQKLAKRKSGNLVVNSTPKKKVKSTKATTAIIRELRRVAAIQARYIYSQKWRNQKQICGMR